MNRSTVFKFLLRIICSPYPSQTGQELTDFNFSYIVRCQQKLWNTKDNEAHEDWIFPCGRALKPG